MPHYIIIIDLYRLESPTRSLEVRASQEVFIQSRAGSIEATSLNDIKMHSIAGSVSHKTKILLLSFYFNFCEFFHRFVSILQTLFCQISKQHNHLHLPAALTIKVKQTTLALIKYINYVFVLMVNSFWHHLMEFVRVMTQTYVDNVLANVQSFFLDLSQLINAIAIKL